ncbi:curlin, partial [Lacinutrix salivirga]
EADVRQRGTDNQSTSIQEGDFNEAITRQGMKEATLGVSEGNRAKIHHGIGQQGESNFAMIEQDGKDNSAKTVQVYDNSDARTVQEGDDNVADIRQDAGPNQSAGHEALLEQYGDDNVSRMRQNGSARNTARSVQLGDDNKSNQNQTSNAASGIGNDAVVDQGSGAGGVFTASAPGIYAGLLGVDNVANGTFNQGSAKAEALQNQSGTENEAYIGQFGIASDQGNYAEQNQDGERNAAAIVQNAFGSSGGGDNYARQDQDGDDNVAGIAQNGVDHLAYQRQYGDNNSALSTQRGNDNHLSTYQGGDGNAVETGQRGTMNTILVVQKEQGWGGHSYKVSQNLPGGTPVGSPNGGNIADILQLGPDGDFAADAEGCDFQDPADLVCPDGLNSFDIANPCDDGTGNGC